MESEKQHGKQAEAESRARVRERGTPAPRVDPGLHLRRLAQRLGNSTLAKALESSKRSLNFGNAASPRANLSANEVAGAPNPNFMPQRVRETLRKPGIPLSPEIRREMESRFQHDLGSVRVQTDSASAASAEEIGARAYTCGEHLVFNKGEYRPKTLSGRHLLAHELAHVIQQRRGGHAPGGPAGAGLESSADRAAAAAVLGAGPVAVGGMSAPGIARTPKGEGWTLAEVTTDGGVVKVEGIPVLSLQWDMTKPQIYINIEASKNNAEKLIDVTVNTNLQYKPIMSAPAEFKKLGFKISAVVNPMPSSQLEDRPIILASPLAPPPKPKPKTKPKPTTAPAATKPTVTKPKATPAVKPDPAPKTPADDVKTGPDGKPLIVMPEMIITGQVDAEDVQIDSGTPSLAPANGDPPPLAADLIDAHTDTWGLNLDEEALGAELAAKARNGQIEVTSDVLDRIGSTDRDDVSVAFAEACTDDDLRALAKTEKGRRLLDRLFDELTAGEVGSDEQKQADRILAIKTQQTITEEKFAEGMAKAKKSIVLPYKKPGITVLTPSPIYARRLADGKISVHVRFDIYGTDYYYDPDIRLPKDIWQEVILNENDIVGVKFYDEGGKIEYFPAVYLLQLENESTRVALHKAAEAFGLGLTLGSGSLAVGGGEAAAEVGTATTLARIGAYARTGVVWADRVATGLDIVNSVIQEHRGWIIEKWPGPGKIFVTDLDQVNSYAQLYGILRGGAGLIHLGASLRKSYQEWRAATRALQGELSPDELKQINQIGNETEKLLHDLDEAARQAPPTPNSTHADVHGSLANPKVDANAALPPRIDADVSHPGALPAPAKGKPELRGLPNVQERVTPPKRGHLTDVSKDAPPLKNPHANVGEELEQVENELQQAEQVQRRAASGDPTSESLQPSMQRQGSGAVNSAGSGRKTPIRAASAGGAGKGSGSNVRPIKSIGGSPARPAPAVGTPVNTLPERFPIPEKGLANYENEELLQFYRARRAEYPPDIRKMLDEIPDGLKKTPLRDRLEALDRAIREKHTAEANALMGKANAAPLDRPFVSSQRANANEGSELSSLLTDEKDLSLTGQLKGGGTAEFDSVAFKGRIIQETKLSLYRGGNPPKLQPLSDVRDQMMRQARFAKDWGFGRVEWNVLDYDSALHAEKALADLRQYHPELAELIRVVHFH